MPVDPVCGRTVEEGGGSLRLDRADRCYFFCSARCLRRFVDSPADRDGALASLIVAWALTAAILGITTLAPGLAASAPSLVFAAAVQFYTGIPLYRAAFEALRSGRGSSALPAAVGSSVAFAFGIAAFVLPTSLPPTIYFLVASWIVAITLSGSFLEPIVRWRFGAPLFEARRAPSHPGARSSGPRPPPAPVRAWLPGDRVEVAPDERFPFDGIVRSGKTAVDDRWRTGTRIPSVVSEGDPVYAGSKNLGEAVLVEVSATGSDTFVEQAARSQLEAEAGRLSSRPFAERFGVVVMILTAVLAAGFAVAAFVYGGAGVGITDLVFVTGLVSALPGLFQIVKPLALLSGSARAARRGVLYRGSEAVDRARSVDLVLTGKAGALTSAVPGIASVRAVPPLADSEVVAYAAGLESGIDHPLARSIRAFALERGIRPRRFDQVVNDPGRGVRGRYGSRSSGILREEAAREDGANLEPLASWTRAAEEAGETWSAVLDGSRLVGGIAFQTTLLPGARSGVEALRAESVDLGLVTCDHARAAQKVASELGLSEVHAGLSPRGKAEVVRDLSTSGRRVAFVGRGDADQEGLAASPLSIRLGPAPRADRSSGPTVLVWGDLEGVAGSIALARAIDRSAGPILFAAGGLQAVVLAVALGVLVPWTGWGVYVFLPLAVSSVAALAPTALALLAARLHSRRDAGLPRPTPVGPVSSTGPS